MPNTAESVIAMLATTSLGAVWSSCSPDFGVAGVVDRFGQIEPRVLVTVDGYKYNAKVIDVRTRVAQIVSTLPSVERVVVLPYLAAAPDLSMIAKSTTSAEFVATSGGPGPPEYRRLPFAHPL